jgi:hypothetical protein
MYGATLSPFSTAFLARRPAPNMTLQMKIKSYELTKEPNHGKTRLVKTSFKIAVRTGLKTGLRKMKKILKEKKRLEQQLKQLK